MTNISQRTRQGALELGTSLPSDSPVECLGMPFESDDARREHFLGRIREKLQGPEFRQTPGFPNGSDEAILRMSDPPYYTACPNPFLEDFVRHTGKAYDPSEKYEREQFAVDVSVGKTNQLYKAHGNHTKVLHLDSDPICPHCAFRPVEEPAASPLGGPKAGDHIDRLDAELDDMLQSWTNTLLGNLQDPTVSGNIELLGAGEGRDAVEAFLKSKSLPDPVSPAFVKALQEILSGLEKVVLTEARLRSALTDGGVPCTVGELKERFDAFVADLTKGKDATRVRVVVERD